MMQFNQFNPVYQHIAQLIHRAVTKLVDGDSFSPEQIYQELAPPPKNDMGEVAFACFRLAKLLKNSPANISKELATEIAKSELVLEAKSFGPYLNFFLDTKSLANTVVDSIIDDSYYQQIQAQNAPKTIIEFSQPNTHKEMHVGHMRNLCLGDAMVKIYRFSGIETLSTTFPGDVGTHVAKCLWYYKKHNKEDPPAKRKGAWLGKLYTKANELLEDQKGSELEDENRKELTAILKQLHSGTGEYFSLWQETRDWSIELMQEVYTWAAVSFDSWYWESDVDADSVKLIKEYQQKGLFVEDAGAVGIDLSEDKLGFCLLLKSDGTGLYATKDIELARRKFKDQHIQKSIYIVDNRQSLHLKQVFKVLEKMGFEDAKNCYHLQYEMVELSDGAMSSRKGNVVPLQDLIDQMQLKIKTDYLEKYQDSWPQAEIDNVAKIVAAGAIKYGMTRVDSNKKIIFVMDEWLKLDGESGPYIQYVCARINSILSKEKISSNYDYSVLKHPIEKDLINYLLQFNAAVANCVENNKTHPLCHYLYHLAKLFNSFYAECPILKADSDEQKTARLRLTKAVHTHLEKGLNLLGIEAPKRM